MGEFTGYLLGFYVGLVGEPKALAWRIVRIFAASGLSKPPYMRYVDGGLPFG